MQDQNTPPSPAEQAAPELVENVANAAAEAPATEEAAGDSMPSLVEQLRQCDVRHCHHDVDDAGARQGRRQGVQHL